VLTNTAFIAGGGTAIVIVTAISTIALYWAYGVPIFLGLFGRQEWRDTRSGAWAGSPDRSRPWPACGSS